MLKHPSKQTFAKAVSNCCRTELNLKLDEKTMKKKEDEARASGVPLDCISYAGVTCSFFCKKCQQACNMVLIPVSEDLHS